MKSEKSAGGIIVRATGEDYDVLLLSDMNSMWTFPKGIIEEGEDPLTTAKREIAEEVGLTDVQYMVDLPMVSYTFKRGSLIEKSVQYYLFFYSGNQTPVGQKEEGIGCVEWVPMAMVEGRVGYPETSIPLLRKVKEILRTHDSVPHTL